MKATAASDDPLGTLAAAIAVARQEQLLAVEGPVGHGDDPLTRLRSLMRGEVEAPQAAPPARGPVEEEVTTVSSERTSTNERSTETVVAEAVLDLLADRPLPGPSRASLAREIAALVSDGVVPAERIRPLLAIVLGLD